MKLRKIKYTVKKPARNQLNGMSASEFKTLLKRQGYDVSRTFYKRGCIAKLGDRLYRFRWWGTLIGSGDETDGAFVVDISCPIDDFDRWANSVDDTISIDTWLKGV